jgi:DNA polymerase/3'-5' exonuclease PolX
VSSGRPIPREQARIVADELVGLLAPACARVEIAGSIRRERDLVSDIEIVATPRYEERAGADLWGTPYEADLLEERIASTDGLGLRAVEAHRQDGSVTVTKRDGRSYKALEYRGMPVDLFIVRPGEQDWGVIFAIRTGPAEWSHQLVTDCQRYLRRVAGGKLYRGGQYVACATEREFFAAIGQEWVEPRDRELRRVHVRP